MPSGYTEGILNGKITTFEQFGKVCLRAMGATMHMRDDDFDKEWYPCEPLEYHPSSISELEAKRERLISMTDQELIQYETEKIKKENIKLRNIIEEKQKLQVLFGSMISQANQYVPPTPDHENLKTYMIQQLNETYKYDCQTEYYEKQLQSNLLALIEIDEEYVKGMREDFISEIDKEILYHQEQYEIELKACDARNKFVVQFFDSLKTDISKDSN